MKHWRFTAAILVLSLLLGMLPAALAEQESTDTYCSATTSGKHSWGEWTTKAEPTCSKAGSRSRTCGRCGYTQTETIRKAGHKWGSWKTTKEATCTRAGEQTRKCGVCGKKETRDIDRKAHTWGEWTVTVEPTDFTMGTRAHTCRVCGTEETEHFYPDGTLRRSDKGGGVKDLQEKLNAAGYDCGKADGAFGKKTEAAVRALEAAHDFNADGIAWPGVQKWLEPVGASISTNSNGGDASGFLGHLRNSPDGDSLFPGPRFRSLEILEQTRNENDYYDGAVIPVMMRLTIDSFDDYEFLGIVSAPGDSIEAPDWTLHELIRDEQYDFIYNMVLDPKLTGWAPRSVTVRLRSLTYNNVEEEVCEVRPPFTLPKVTIAGGSDHVIDYPASLYLSVRVKSFTAFAREGIDLPVTVKGNAAGDFTNVRLEIEELRNGTVLSSETRALTGRMGAQESRSFMQRWTNNAPEGWHGACKIRLCATGVTLDKKGDPQVIRSQPVELDLNIGNPADQKGMLELTYALDPAGRDPLWSRDKVRFTFKMKNTGTTVLENVRVEFTEPYAHLRALLGDFGSVINGELLKPGETAETTLEFDIPPAIADEKRVQMSVVAWGSNATNHTPVRSKSLWILRGVTDKMPEEGLRLQASVADPMDTYQAGTKHSVALTVTNAAGKAVKALRVYAVGDNRGTKPEGAGRWFDLGHGAKGWQVLDVIALDVAPGEQAQFRVYAEIPEGVGDGGSFRAGWIVDAELADGTPVRSNVATLNMKTSAKETPAEAGMALTAELLTDMPDPEGWHDGDTVKIWFHATYTGEETPAKIRADVYNILVAEAIASREKAEVKEYADEIEFQLDASNAIDGICYYDLYAHSAGQADGSGRLFADPRSFTFPMIGGDAKDPAEDGTVSLSVKALTETDDPNGLWHDGDKVDVAVKAEYLGEEVPAKLEVVVYDSYGDLLPGETRETLYEKTLDYGNQIELDAELALKGTCKYTCVARVYLSDSDVPDHVSEKVPLSFILDPGEKDSQINWDPITKIPEDVETGANGGQSAEGAEAEDAHDAHSDKAHGPAQTYLPAELLADAPLESYAGYWKCAFIDLGHSVVAAAVMDETTDLYIENATLALGGPRFGDIFWTFSFADGVLSADVNGQSVSLALQQDGYLRMILSDDAQETLYLMPAITEEAGE